MTEVCESGDRSVAINMVDDNYGNNSSRIYRFNYDNNNSRNYRFNLPKQSGHQLGSETYGRHIRARNVEKKGEV